MPVLSKPRLTLGLFSAAFASYALLVRRYGLFKARTEEKQTVFVAKSKESKKKVGVGSEFYKQIIRLLKICVPGWFSPEAGYLTLVAATLVARTLCDLWMININTTLERTIITRDAKAFGYHIVQFIVSVLPIAMVNNLMKYGLEELSMRFRARLVLFHFSIT